MKKFVNSEKEYEDSLLRISDLMQKTIKLNTPEYHELKSLSILVKDFESKNFHIPKPGLLDSIKFRKEQMKTKKQ
ncbi:transcriptional regulator [Elizabethkingia anophelis]|nr:transcriptional regulator [Elizabethkingia anophelis]